MQVKQVRAENLTRSYDIIVPSATIEQQVQARLASLGKNVKIKGFREGKAPMEMIRKQYGLKVRGEVLEQVVSETSKKALEQEKLRPVMQPKIAIADFEEGKDLKYSMEIEILPELPQIDYGSITIEKLEIESSGQDVEEAIARLATQVKQWDSVARAAAKGDAVKIDFEGFIDDVPFAGGKASGHVLELGSNQFIPGFEEQLEGAKAGDAKDVNVSFPKAYHSKDLAGKKARFAVKVHEVMQAKKADINDALAKEFGLGSLEELRNKMKEQLQSDMNVYVRNKLKGNILDALDERYEFDIPPSMQKVEFDAIWQQLQNEKQQGRPTELDTKSEDEVRGQYETLARRRVKLGILLSGLADREHVHIGQQDVLNEINKRAAQFPGQEEQVKEFYQKNQRAVNELVGPLLEEKVIDFLAEKVTLSTRKVTVKALLEEEEALHKAAPKAKKSSDGSKTPSASKKKKKN